MAKNPFKNNFLLLFGGIFAFVGTVMGIVAGAVFWNTENTIRNGVRTYGEVIGLNNTSGKGSYAPVIEFELENGEKRRYYSNMSSNPPAYDLGETVKLWYDPADPDDVVLSGLDRWFLPALFGGFFVVFGAIGYGSIFYQIMRSRRKKWLLANGRPIEAAFLDVGLKHNIKVNNRSPFVIHAQWHDPATNTVYTYESDHLWYDPSLFLTDHKKIPVFIDPQNPRSYHVDLSFLPEEGN